MFVFTKLTTMKELNAQNVSLSRLRSHFFCKYSK